MPGTVSLPFLGRPTVRVRRVPGVERLQVVLQDVFVHLGGVSSSNASKRIRSARERIGRDVAIHQVREGPNVLLTTTLTDAVDLLIEVDVPAARELRHQLIQLGKLVLGGDPDGTVAAEIRANKQLLDAMPSEDKSLFEELLEPEARVPENALASPPQSDDSRWREELTFKREQLALRRTELEHERVNFERERPTKILRVAEQYKAMMQDLDMFGPVEQMALKDAVTNGLSMIGGNSSLNRQLALTNGTQSQADAGETLLTVSEWLSLYHDRVISPKDIVGVGKAVAAAYRQELTGDPFGDVEPVKKTQSVGGRITMVNAYSSKPVAPGKRSGQDIVRDVLAAKNLF